MPYQYFTGKERTIELFLSSPVSTSVQIKSVLSTGWPLTYF